MNAPGSPNTNLPRIKICGITKDEDLEYLRACGVDAVGLNLVPSSRRHLTLDVAIHLASRAVELQISVVAVVMDPSVDALKSISRAFPWNFIQLHGSESPEMVEACNSIAVIKACSWSGRTEEEELIRSWRDHFGGSISAPMNLNDSGQRKLAAFLLDSYAPGVGGGTGKTARWDLVRPRSPSLADWPIMLAGGLTANNVSTAIEQSGCDAVDTASGVEITPGVKDRQLVETFARAAKVGFASIALTGQ